MSAIEQALDANDRYAVERGERTLPATPRRKLAVVVCMDARIDPAKALGLQEGDAHVIRNAGGRIADALRSLVVSQEFLGTQEVMVVHHTDCGMSTFTDESLRARLKTRGIDAGAVAFLPFGDIEESVRDDLAAYDASPLVRHDIPVRGFVYDVHTGRVHEVERRPRARTAGA